MNKLKNYLNELGPVKKFIFRITYPVLLFSLMYFIFRLVEGENTSALQLIFILIWAVIEYLVFFRD